MRIVVFGILGIVMAIGVGFLTGWDRPWGSFTAAANAGFLLGYCIPLTLIMLAVGFLTRDRKKASSTSSDGDARSEPS